MFKMLWNEKKLILHAHGLSAEGAKADVKKHTCLTILPFCVIESYSLFFHFEYWNLSNIQILLNVRVDQVFHMFRGAIPPSLMVFFSPRSNFFCTRSNFFCTQSNFFFTDQCGRDCSSAATGHCFGRKPTKKFQSCFNAVCKPIQLKQTFLGKMQEMTRPYKGGQGENPELLECCLDLKSKYLCAVLVKAKHSSLWGKHNRWVCLRAMKHCRLVKASKCNFAVSTYLGKVLFTCLLKGFCQVHVGKDWWVKSSKNVPNIWTKRLIIKLFRYIKDNEHAGNIRKTSVLTVEINSQNSRF